MRKVSCVVCEASRSCPFTALRCEERSPLSSLIQHQLYQKGETIFHQGAVISGLFPELLPYLAPLKEHLLIGLAPVVPTRAGERYKDFCFLSCDYVRVQTRLDQLLKDEGFTILVWPIAADVTENTSVFCGAYQVDSYMIDPEGHLYKCTALAGEIETKVGTLLPSGEIVYDWDRLLPWLIWEPFEDAMCSTCPVLPLCLGGCHADRLYKGYQGHGVVLPCIEARSDLAGRLQVMFGTSRKSPAHLSHLTVRVT